MCPGAYPCYQFLKVSLLLAGRLKFKKLNEKCISKIREKQAEREVGRKQTIKQAERPKVSICTGLITYTLMQINLVYFHFLLLWFLNGIFIPICSPN